MNTVTFKSVFNAAARRAGLDPANNLPAGTVTSLAEYIDFRVRSSWEGTLWPDMILVEQRALRPEFDSDVLNPLNDEIHYAATGLYYKCKESNTGVDPTNPLYWDELTHIDPYLLLATRGQTVIGTVLDVTRRDPRLHPNGCRVRFMNYGDRIRLLQDGGLAVWVKFRLAAPKFTRTAYAGGTAYVVGDVVYDDTTGECYAAVQAGTGHVVTDADYWVKQDLPLILRDWAVLGAASDLHREDGQFAKAGGLEALAQRALEAEEDRIFNQTSAVWA